MVSCIRFYSYKEIRRSSSDNVAAAGADPAESASDDGAAVVGVVLVGLVIFRASKLL